MIAAEGISLYGRLGRTGIGWCCLCVDFLMRLNALLSCGDLLGVGLDLWQIPANAIVRNKGWKTYWRRNEPPTSPGHQDGLPE